MRIRVTRLTVVPEGKPIYDETATEVEITDEGGGEFLIIKQTGGGQGEIRIDAEEWRWVREAIDRMIKEAQPRERPNSD